MLKAVICILVVAFSTYLGYFFSEKYRRRKKFMAQLYSFNERFISELSYERRPLKEFFSKYEYKGDFLKLLEGYLEKKPECSFPFLTADDINYVNGYFSSLGKGDAYEQSGYFTAQRDSLSSLKEESERDEKKYGGLYIKLGFLAGLAAAVVIA